MIGDDPVAVAQASEARRWTWIADRDLATEEHCLRADPPLTESAAYFCQQAAEKLIKALLVAAAVAFPKTHDLKDLATRVRPRYAGFEPMLDAIIPLTVWGTAFRYPAEEQAAETPPTVDAVRLAIRQLRVLRAAVAQQIEQQGVAR